MFQGWSPDIGALYREDCANISSSVATHYFFKIPYFRQIPRTVALPQADNTGVK
ncbi:MAG: hypothetical protein UY04_C0065G0003 [Parcubacteria group bacterium GW2011_GWA2_47_7]|nr:MAG: hypothetical protein UY04_C0065G0003 [Parcubacteria group bacterium GW2011_GWA2_47_7]